MKPPSNKNRAITKINALTYAQLIKYLLEGGHSCTELAEHTGLHYVTVLNYTRAMYRAGVLHIAAWETDSRNRAVIKIYAIGNKRDAVRPKMSVAQRAEFHRAKLRQIKTLDRLRGTPVSVAVPDVQG